MVLYQIQIIGDGNVKPRFAKLASSILGEESVLNDMSYLHSPESKKNLVEIMKLMSTIFSNHYAYHFPYLIISALDDVKPVTHLLAVDVTSVKGMKLLHEGIRYLVILCD